VVSPDQGPSHDARPGGGPHDGDSRHDASRHDDPYQERLYAAEHQALPDGGRRFRRFAELEQWVATVVLGPWWESTFPAAPLDVTVLRRSSGATFSAARVEGDEAALWIRDGSWDVVTVVHELTHVAVGPDHGTDGPHGVRFATTLLVCWRELIGVQAYGALRSTLDRNGVPYHRGRLG
jgi:putative metallohydrolase (TIGR04338 family)